MRFLPLTICQKSELKVPLGKNHNQRIFYLTLMVHTTGNLIITGLALILKAKPVGHKAKGNKMTNEVSKFNKSITKGRQSRNPKKDTH